MRTAQFATGTYETAPGYETYRIDEPPKIVGHWEISPGFHIQLTKRPTWRQRFAGWVLGWKWEDART